MHDRLKEQLIEMEGEVLHAYQDHLGFWTIGVGHLIDKRKGGGIKQEVSRWLLDDDIKAAEFGLASALPWFWKLDPIRRAALINMTFQMGVAGVLGFKRMLAALEIGDYPAAAYHALDSKWAVQTPKRALKIARQLRWGEWQ